ncbi:hypothetical protein LVJ94_34665 [Pendulispora rubella]|uniref:Uncharacterized protein n=1 Tax=Pendulispora rubella TaxID=2741070 RepID=A0ABZ2KTT2_9BACT
MKVSVKVGHVTEEFAGDDDADEKEVSDLDAYVAVDVTVNGKDYSVGCCVGIYPSEQGSARQSGAMSCYGGGPTAWWSDPSDCDMLEMDHYDDVLHALEKAAGRLWREVEALRERPAPRKRSS